MFSVLMVILLIISVILVIIVLMQSSKGGGLSGAFGGAGGVGTVFGVRRTADFLTRATWALAISFMVLCLVINLWFLPSEATQESIIRRSAQEEPVPMQPQTPQPSVPTGAERQQPGQTPPPAESAPQ